jgi:hypothetical protein
MIVACALREQSGQFHRKGTYMGSADSLEMIANLWYIRVASRLNLTQAVSTTSKGSFTPCADDCI